MDALRKQASKLREQVAKQQQVTHFTIVYVLDFFGIFVVKCEIILCFWYILLFGKLGLLCNVN